MNIKPEEIKLAGIIAFLATSFSYLILGLSGAVSILGIMLFFVLPTYLIMQNFNIDQDEKIIFSFFAGVGIFPSIAYYLGMIMSFKLGLFVTFMLLAGTGFLISKSKKHDK